MRRERERERERKWRRWGLARRDEEEREMRVREAKGGWARGREGRQGEHRLVRRPLLLLHATLSCTERVGRLRLLYVCMAYCVCAF